jgi:hypothetical protein
VTPAISPLLLFLIAQLGGAIWWASKISTMLENIQTQVRECRVDLSALRAEVQSHSTDLAVIHATTTSLRP